MRTRPVCPVPRAHERRARERPRMQGEGGEAEERRQAGRGRRKRPDPRWRSAHVQERRAAMAERPLSAPDEHTNARISQLRRKMRPPLPPASHVEHENEERKEQKNPSPLRSSSPRGAEAMRESEKDRDASEGAPTSPLHRFEGRTRRRCLFFFKFEIKRPNVPQCGDWRQLLSTPNFCVFQLHAHLLTPELTSPDRRVDSAGAGFRAFVRRASC